MGSRHIAIVAACLLALAADGEPDYLDETLRTEVEALKAEVARTPSSRANAGPRARTVWEWINAYALTGRYVPVNATQTASGVLAYPANAGRVARLDAVVREMTLLDEQPDAIGTLVADTGPFTVRTHATIRQIYTVGSKDIATSGGIVVARHFMTGMAFQTDDETGDNYISIASSNPTVRFSKSTTPMSGMHGGFRAAADTLVFRLISGRLTKGDTVTVTYGDTSGGSRGLLLPSFSSDRMPMPLYIDFDGGGEPISLPIQPIVVVGGETAGVHGFAPSVVAIGEPFDVYMRAQDRFYNRATDTPPTWEVEVNGKPYPRELSSRDAIGVIKDVRLDAPGVYRFSFRSKDGAIVGGANPILVEERPARRIYWGDTHGHSGFAEGIGTPDRFMIWARDDARLDYVTHSEHDIWMDDFEWNVLKDNVQRYSSDGFVAFLGYEWTIQNIQGGHHNVLFRTTKGRQRISGHEYSTLSALYQGLRRHNDPSDVVVIPHAHQAGDYRQNDPSLQPLVEIMAQHGTFEWFGRMYLKHGHQVGFTAASDNHLSQPGYSAPQGGSLSQRGGLGALRAQNGSRDELFDAMKNLAVYATTGDRMILDFTVNGAEMGQRTPFEKTRKIAGRVVGTAPIHTIEIVKNDKTLWQRDYLSNTSAEVGDGEYLLTFESDSTPFHPGDNPRGWRWWRGQLSAEGAVVEAAEGMNFHNVNTQSIDRLDGANLTFSTHTRGGSSSIRLVLKDVRRTAKLTLKLRDGREFGGGPPRFRAHQQVPAQEVTLELRKATNGEVYANVPFDGFQDAVTLRRIVTEGDMDVSFTLEDAGDRQGDYYYVRVTQANDAMAWSSPIWVGGYPSR